MKRRQVLKMAGGMVILAGCSGDSEDTPQDSDGDGVIDENDYAPNDPEVQNKSDLVSTLTVSETPAPTPTATPPPTPTPSPSPTPTPEPQTPESIEGLVTESRYLKPIWVRGYADEYTEGVQGAVENVSDRLLDYVGVDVFFYRNDTRVGDSLDNTSDLPPDTKWEFDAPYTGDSEWNSFVGVVDHRL